MRAKFKVNSITKSHDMNKKADAPEHSVYPRDWEPREIHTVHLSAVSDDANKTWAKFTPSGSLQITINNPDAVGFLKLGESYFLDFTVAPAAE